MASNPVPRVSRPSITIPVYKGPNGLPVVAQLVAKHHDDPRLFAVARWAYERLT